VLADQASTSARNKPKMPPDSKTNYATTFFDSIGQNRKSSMRSAVGTVIADRPPPKSVQAEFPHTAPTLGA
jgi:hypothetical protein